MEDAAYSLPVGGHVQGHYSNPLFPSALVERLQEVHLGRNLNFGRTQQLGANPLRTTKRHGMLGILLPKFDISWWWRSEPNNDRFEIRSGNPRPISPSVAEACVQRDWTSVYDTADNTVAV
ncbi:hypothetical protein NEUTE1DRAFT_110582 [Neurospora tetrasperma FGSC 2508]|uniref:Uncharacterized protein n=1 Tax=Neurospora tetrasperma (strain FGSC 2508 / ATCC MYA-4615 / P0657) TaxID=510951 RepID=F8MLW7_NEUT8|nr:uncharacterized protein NEUTE1DRAFT_110582 [Neurospora tetrasperma FGSC 2508]EGO58482.1 hypothetical protein NEUTE1DRAFT_110582 [Neurospora tetrasperma FGSC 2508]